MATKQKLQNKCKLCNLLHVDKDLWVAVHERILKDTAKRTHVCKWLNSQIELLNANLKPGQSSTTLFNVANFTAHFKKHVPNIKLMKAELRAALKDAPRANDGFTDAEQDIAHEVINAEDDAHAASYAGYPEMLAKMEAVILRDLMTVQGITDSRGKLKVSSADKNMRLLQSLLSVKRGLAEVQRTEQVGGSAVRHALVRIGEEVVSATNKLAIELRETLKQQMPDSSLPSEVESMITSRTVETIKGVYPDILAEIYKLYGIK